MENIDDNNNHEKDHDSTVDGDELLAEAAALHDPVDPVEAEAASGAYGAATGGHRYGDPLYSASPPPYEAPSRPVLEDRLTRDPNASLGGVLSGIAHRYGWDVAITRLVFIVAVFLSGGGAIPIYLLAWLIVPRAKMWPPVQRQLSGISGRDLGVGVLFIATLIFLGVGFDNGAPVLVPLLLVGAGVYLLNQNPRPESATAFAEAAAPPRVGPQDAPYGQYSAYAAQPVAPQPVPQRSRRRSGMIIGGLLTLILVPFALIGIGIAVLGSGSVDVDFADDGPANVIGFVDVDEIPGLISEEDGKLVIDLADVDFSDVETGDPIELDVRMDAGEMTVLLPDNVRADIRAESQFFGEVVVFNEVDEGVGPQAFVDVDEPQLVLDLEVKAGKIEVSSVGAPSAPDAPEFGEFD